MPHSRNFNRTRFVPHGMVRVWIILFSALGISFAVGYVGMSFAVQTLL